QIMVWWALQLAAIQTITCFYDLAKMYESHRLPKKIAKKQGETIDNKEELEKQFKKLQPKMIKGEYIGQTWFYDFLFKALLPILAILSVPFCVYWAADIFEMAPVCRKIFQYVFLNKPGIIQLSLYKICLTLELFFLFRYLNYAIRAFYQMLKKRRKKNEIRSQGNSTLAYNVISILVWGLYVLLCMMILEVSGKGISIVMAGLATGLGFAMKDLLENFIYGITLMTGRLRVGDYIECDGVQGKVDSINYQSTQLVTLDGSVIAFQNATLFSKNFKNLTRNHGYVLVKIPVGVAYGVNVENVRKMLLHDLQPLMTKNAAGKYLADNKQGFKVIFDDFGESSVDLYVICWVLVEEKAAFVAKVKEVIYNTLNKNKIEIPFPQRDVYVRHLEMPTQKAKTKKQEPETIETEPEIVEETVVSEETKKAPRRRHRKPKQKEE
ncbi:MAG: mechanosensitive ion channel family protein, partial [Bacteroidales bacterium]|nr:mechanosensitive ion channel family protein [Bacteroidales bacterium]